MSDNNKDNHFDLIIIGGGLAGASLACALKNAALEQPMKIAVVEAYEIKSDQQPCYDDRTVALSYGSSLIFDGMGVWQRLAPYAEAINAIHISDRGHFGVTRLTRQQENVEALGYVMENRDIGQQLYADMSASDQIRLFCPAQISALTQADEHIAVEVLLDGEPQLLSADLLVAADGNRSQVLQLLNIGSSRKDYAQSALVTNVTTAHKHQNVAYERFTDTGPLAFLPMRDNRCSVVWSLPPAQAEALCQVDENEFIAQLQQRFGFRLGQIIKSGKRQVYPLILQSATQMISSRVAVIGNAAHSVHPVAGQGFNLALRDIAMLAELVVDNTRRGQDIGDTLVLQQYAKQREQDVNRVYRFTDGLVKTFSNAIAPLAHGRSLGLLAVDVLPDLKHVLATHSMGMGGPLTRLNRGLPL